MAALCVSTSNSVAHMCRAGACSEQPLIKFCCSFVQGWCLLRTIFPCMCHKARYTHIMGDLFDQAVCHRCGFYGATQAVISLPDAVYGDGSGEIHAHFPSCSSILLQTVSGFMKHSGGPVQPLQGFLLPPLHLDASTSHSHCFTKPLLELVT